MPVTLPQSVKKLLLDKAYGHVVTSNAEGKPQVTMVWMDVDGDEVLFNTAEGRRKTQNLRRDPRIIVSVQDRNDPQAYAVFHPGRSDWSCGSASIGSAASVRRCSRGHSDSAAWISEMASA